jgi:hypothetical protein
MWHIMWLLYCSSKNKHQMGTYNTCVWFNRVFFPSFFITFLWTEVKQMMQYNIIVDINISSIYTQYTNTLIHFYCTLKRYHIKYLVIIIKLYDNFTTWCKTGSFHKSSHAYTSKISLVFRWKKMYLKYMHLKYINDNLWLYIKWSSW